MGRPSRLSGRLGPVGHPSGGVVYLRQGTASCSAEDFSSSGHLSEVAQWLSFATTPQLCIPFARGVPLVSSPHHLGSGDLALDGVHLHPPASPVPSGLRHRPNRLPVSPSPAHTSRVVFTYDRLSVFETTVAGSNVFFATSATHRIRFTSPLSGIRGQQAWTRFSRSRTAFGLPRSLRWLSSAYFREVPGIHGDGTQSCDSPLGSAPLVFGPGPALAGSSNDPTVPSIPPAIDSVSSSLPGSQLAQASCLAPLQRFSRAAGFSSAIAEQSALARRPSSRAVYQVR